MSRVHECVPFLLSQTQRSLFLAQFLTQFLTGWLSPVGVQSRFFDLVTVLDPKERKKKGCILSFTPLTLHCNNTERFNHISFSSITSLILSSITVTIDQETPPKRKNQGDILKKPWPP